MAVIARLDRRISVKKDDLGCETTQNIKALLTIPDGDVAKSIAQGVYGARGMPGFIELYEEDLDVLYMPRGFATMLRSGLAGVGVELQWDDHTSFPQIPLGHQLKISSPNLRPDQEQAVQQILLHRQGVLQADPGRGKTVVALEAWRRTGAKGIVLVEKGQLATQWRERARQHLGIEVGMIGDGSWEERDLTIAMLQSLRSRRFDLDRSGFFRSFGFVVVDECHHLTSTTYRDVVGRFSSRYMLGMTATPLEGDWRRPLMNAIIGEVFHVVDGASDVEPVVKMVKTEFAWEPKTKADQSLVDTRVIYRRVIDALLVDEDRLSLIAETICAQPESSSQLVVSSSLVYLTKVEHHLKEYGYDPESIFMMTGKESPEERQHVAEIADEGHCVILSTVAGEGTDIARLDRLHLVWPARAALGVIQKIGRLGRAHPDKTDAVVIDYVDHRQGFLRSQCQARIRDVYNKKGLMIEWPKEREHATT